MSGVDELAEQVSGLYSRFISKSSFPTDVVELERVWDDADPRWITDQLEKREITEQDILPVRHFNAGMGAIIDVGAHWGYTALSMRLTGTDCPIISFEAVAANEPSLKKLKEVDPSYDYYIGALSDHAHEVSLFNPVVNGHPICGLNSVEGLTLTEHHVLQTAQAIRSWLPGATQFDVKLGRYRTNANKLDAIIRSESFRVDISKIAVVKIDVEGHEGEVLRGMDNTLAIHKPLLIIEIGANSHLPDYLISNGYRLAVREGDILRRSDANLGFSNNYYFYHVKAEAIYKNIGLLQD